MESMGTSVSAESRIRDTSIDYFPSFMAYHICGQIVHDIGEFFRNNGKCIIDPQIK
jgi:hypothetical protein